MSWIPIASLGFSVLTFFIGMYYNERKHKSQRKGEIIDDIYPKLNDAFNYGLSEYRNDFKLGYLINSDSLFQYLRRISENGRINYIKFINKKLFVELGDFLNSVIPKLKELDAIRREIKNNVKKCWGDIEIKYDDKIYLLSQINISSKGSLLESIHTRLFWEFWRDNKEEIRQVIFQCCNDILEDWDEYRIIIDPPSFISILSEVFNNEYNKFLEPYNELEQYMCEEIERDIKLLMKNDYKI